LKVAAAVATYDRHARIELSGEAPETTLEIAFKGEGGFEEEE
jgi:hypothetical protein